MNSTTDLDNKIRDFGAQLDRATPPPPPFHELERNVRPSARRLVPLVAAATIVAVGVGGLMAVSARDTDTTPPQTSAPDVVITDPLAISLDEWADPANAVEPCPCVVLDLAHLPDAWTGTTMSAGYNLATGGYRSRVALTHPDRPGLTPDRPGLTLTLQAWAVDPPTDPTTTNGTTVTIGDDANGHLTPTTLTWQPSEGLQATLDIGDNGPDVVIDLARNLPLTTVEHLAPIDPGEPTGPPRDPKDAELAGTINGHAWQVDVGPATAININLAVDGYGVDAMSRDGDDPPPGDSMDISIFATGDDIVLYGRTPPSATSLTVEVSNQPDFDVPVYRRDTDTVFGVPIPNGLAITGLAFTNDNGDVVHRVLIPELPTPIVSMGLEQTFNNPTGQPLI